MVFDLFILLALLGIVAIVAVSVLLDRKYLKLEAMKFLEKENEALRERMDLKGLQNRILLMKLEEAGCNQAVVGKIVFEVDSDGNATLTTHSYATELITLNIVEESGKGAVIQVISAQVAGHER
jgi:hypothetical protein